jgi:hypothetical protein
MSHRTQLAKVIEEVIESEKIDPEDVNPEMLNGYKSLNEKCDVVISKIKKRKSKNQPLSEE